MEKLKSSLTNMLLVLTAIAVIAGGALAMVNSVTAPQIENIKQENLADGINKVLNVEEGTNLELDIDTIYFEGKEHIPTNIQFVSYRCDKGIAVSSVENGFGGELQVLVGFNKEGSILGYTVLQTAETPGLGAKAADWFQKGANGDIIGKNPGQCNFTVSKDGGDIDAITASTITSRAFLLAIQNAYKIIAGKDGTTSAAQASKAEQPCCADSVECDSINE